MRQLQLKKKHRAFLEEKVILRAAIKWEACCTPVQTTNG